MHHDINPEQNARLHIYRVLVDADPVANLDPFDILRAAHWIATGHDPDSHITYSTGDTPDVELGDCGTDKPITWRPAVTN